MNLSVLSGNLHVPLTALEIDLFHECKKIGETRFFTPSFAKLDPKKVQPTHLAHVLGAFFKEMLGGAFSFDPLMALERLSSIIPLEVLEKTVQKDSETILKEAKSMLHEAELYVKTTQERSSDWKVHGQVVFDAAKTFIDTLIMALGVKEMFDPLIHESFKFQKIMMILTLFTVIGAAVGGAIMTEILIGIGALSLIWPLIKPMASHLPPNAECLTKQIQAKSLYSQVRKESLDEIAAILKMNRHAMLIGPSRVGKSLTTKAFAEAVHRGDYPEFKGKVVFRLNTADLIDHYSFFSGGASKILNEISTCMGRHRNQIILVLDEIHMACKNKQKMADQLKPFLDEGGLFPHVIGITTEEEYQKHVKENQAFSLRFDPVNIRSTNEEETLLILGQTILKSRFKPLLSGGNVLKYIYDRSCLDGGLPQPASALKLLKQCIHQTGRTQNLPTERKIAELSRRISSSSLNSILQAARNSEIDAQISQMEKQMERLQEKLNLEKKQIERFFKAKDLLCLTKEKMYATLIKVAHISQKELSFEDKKQINFYLLLREFLINFIEPHIQETSKHLGFKAIIDKILVDEMVSESKSGLNIQSL